MNNMRFAERLPFYDLSHTFFTFGQKTRVIQERLRSRPEIYKTPELSYILLYNIYILRISALICSRTFPLRDSIKYTII